MIMNVITTSLLTDHMYTNGNLGVLFTTKWLWCLLTNQVKLYPSNECLCHGDASFPLVMVVNACCVSARVVYY